MTKKRQYFGSIETFTFPKCSFLIIFFLWTLQQSTLFLYTGYKTCLSLFLRPKSLVLNDFKKKKTCVTSQKNQTFMNHLTKRTTGAIIWSIFEHNIKYCIQDAANLVFSEKATIWFQIKNREFLPPAKELSKVRNYTFFPKLSFVL